MTLEQKMDFMLEQMCGLRSDVNELKEDVSGLKEDTYSMKSEVCILRCRMDSMEGKVDVLTERVDIMEDKMDLMKEDTSSLKSGQLQIRKDLNIISERVTMTYDMALENWGQIAESKIRLNILEN